MSANCEKDLRITIPPLPWTYYFQDGFFPGQDGSYNDIAHDGRLAFDCTSGAVNVAPHPFPTIYVGATTITIGPYPENRNITVTGTCTLRNNEFSMDSVFALFVYDAVLLVSNDDLTIFCSQAESPKTTPINYTYLLQMGDTVYLDLSLFGAGANQLQSTDISVSVLPV